MLGGAASVGIAAVAGLGATGRLDDVVRELGVEPVPHPAPSDRDLLAAAAMDTAALIAVVGPHSESLTRLLEEHLEALGGGESDAAVAVDLASALTRIGESAVTRRQQSLDAVSPDLARTLGSMAVALDLMTTGVVA